MTVRIRCVVCGHEADTPDAAARAGARGYADGAPRKAEDDEDLVHAVYPDGVIAGSCTQHTADEARAAWVLTRWKLHTLDGSEVPV